jgi:uncharacterized membrane protein YphA (DoxX/SURF4 family)
MDYLLLALKLIVSLSILNVWLLNRSNASQWRGGNAQSLSEEFEAYGLPSWSLYVVGFFKVSFALLLLLSIFYPSLAIIGSLGLAFFLSGSVLMHIKISDPLKKSIPAASFLIICLLIAYLVQ